MYIFSGKTTQHSVSTVVLDPHALAVSLAERRSLSQTVIDSRFGSKQVMLPGSTTPQGLPSLNAAYDLFLKNMTQMLPIKLDGGKKNRLLFGIIDNSQQDGSAVMSAFIERIEKNHREESHSIYFCGATLQNNSSLGILAVAAACMVVDTCVKKTSYRYNGMTVIAMGAAIWYNYSPTSPNEWWAVQLTLLLHRHPTPRLDRTIQTCPYSPSNARR